MLSTYMHFLKSDLAHKDTPAGSASAARLSHSRIGRLSSSSSSVAGLSAAAELPAWSASPVLMSSGVEAAGEPTLASGLSGL